ncbi:helix-turn-helix domain-containing protein [Yinghuangia sp. YIM S09857]|uniref:helix-turn-helix domain-containing protein n=1 Tax=Yinghuangia sp. YIM S09857 TaxID=3436929 RepID=UPI003F53919D
MDAREAMRRRSAKAQAEAEAAPDTSHAAAMTAGDVAEFDQAYAEAALGDAMAQAVYDRRVQLAWSKAELARRAGMNERVVRRLEDGGRPVTAPTLLKLGHALGGHFHIELRGDNPVVAFEPAASDAAHRAVQLAAARALLDAGLSPEQTRVLLHLPATGVRVPAALSGDWAQLRHEGPSWDASTPASGVRVRRRHVLCGTGRKVRRRVEQRVCLRTFGRDPARGE